MGEKSNTELKYTLSPDKGLQNDESSYSQNEEKISGKRQQSMLKSLYKNFKEKTSVKKESVQERFSDIKKYDLENSKQYPNTKQTNEKIEMSSDLDTGEHNDCKNENFPTSNEQLNEHFVFEEGQNKVEISCKEMYTSEDISKEKNKISSM